MPTPQEFLRTADEKARMCKAARSRRGRWETLGALPHGKP
eukprot:CAMPEP_0203861952 /NCGR_PEP_ID=MMETSP0359-20131031/13315_1 /ASSEMBLY_ACC=CAM_ASM_000338 /TAXON_ID=268821 /ORGANISM="Scrippsiella Hangoei, Strain SHTV-5" /LENGTH=39 /DNA_ID= /DNA_START= /DNA_END= /DNA_ORIENTATION=